MPTCSKTKETNWGSLATFFDVVSLPDQVPWGRWRHVLNAASFDAGKLCRRPGFRQYGFDKPATNGDLHDQLLGFIGGYAELPGDPGEDVVVYPPGPGLCGERLTVQATPEPITSIYVHTSPSTARRLIAGTQSRIYSQFTDGRWRILADNLGGPPNQPSVRFRFASCLTVVIAVNDTDAPRFHIIDEPIRGCAAQAFHPAADLEAIGLSHATCVASWKGVVFLGDVVMDGAHVSHRIVWSNVNDPFGWVPRDESIAGFQDLDPGERIMAMEVIADGLYVFTDRSIWRVTFAGDQSVFLMQQVYRQKDGEGCIWARHTLAIWNNTAIYLGLGGAGSSTAAIYFYSPFSGPPVAPEWLNMSAGLINAPATACDLIVAGYSPEEDEYLVSWPTVDGALPSQSMAVRLALQVTSEVDHGFSAISAVRLKPELELADFLVGAGICDALTVAGLFPQRKAEPKSASAAPSLRSVGSTFRVEADFYSQDPTLEPPGAQACINHRLDLMLADIVLDPGCRLEETTARGWVLDTACVDGVCPAVGEYRRLARLVETKEAEWSTVPCDYDAWWAHSPENSGEHRDGKWYIFYAPLWMYVVDVRIVCNEPEPPPTEPPTEPPPTEPPIPPEPPDPPDPPDPPEPPEPPDPGNPVLNPDPNDPHRGVLYSCRSIRVPEGFDVEDYTQPPVKCSIQSFCDKLAAVDCRARCPEIPLFLAASSTDYTLKDFRGDYYARDLWQGTLLVRKPYRTRFRTGALDFGRTEKWKVISLVNLFFTAEATDTPRSISLRIGTSSVPSDPLDPKCAIRWFNCKPKELSCPIGNNDRLFWSVIMQGRYLYLDLDMPEVTGGAVCFSRLSVDMAESLDTSG